MFKPRLSNRDRSAGKDEQAGDTAAGSASSRGSPAEPDTSAGNSSDPGSTDAVLIVSGNGIISNLLSGSGTLFDIPADSIAGSPVEALWPVDSAIFVRESIKRTLRSREIFSKDMLDTESGRHYEFMFIAQGRDRVLIVVRDISERKAAATHFEHLAFADELTGLPNREYLLRELRRINDGLQLKGGRAAVVLLAIDKLDLVGSVVRERTQDEVLKELANRLRNGLRGVNKPSDIDDERYSIAARTDFRQFGFLLPNIESGADAATVTARITTAFQEPVIVETKRINVTVSAGIAMFPQDGTDTSTLYDNALAAMEDAKRNDSEPQKFHSGTVNVRALERQDLELELRSALDREEFELSFLPIVNCDTGFVTGAEILLRWPQGAVGAKSIRQVIALAEHTGVIIEIGEWVVRRGGEQLRAWHEEGFSDLRLGVNLSVQEFSRSDLAERIAEILGNCSVDPGYVDFDITEHLLFRDAMKGFAVSNGLKKIGAGLVVDDFGTGACSLAHLSRSPVDAVKIDNSFVAGVADNEGDRAACAAAVAMAHELGLEVIAEGVETAAQAGILQEMGCDFLQGYLFCKPVPAPEFGKMLGIPGSRRKFV